MATDDNNRIALEELIDARRVLHEESEGKRTNWSLSRRVLRELVRLGPFDRSAETGCGSSTLILTALSSEHHCFTLFGTERDRVLSAIEEDEIERAGSVEFHLGDTAQTLPALREDLNAFDLVLIDGAHAFPYPEIDWYYLGRRLTVDGTLVVDDIWMPSVQVLTRFLDQENGWLETYRDNQTVMYRRESAVQGDSVFPDGWDAQGMNSRAARRVALGRELSPLSWTERFRSHPLETLKIALRAVQSRT